MSGNVTPQVATPPTVVVYGTVPSSLDGQFNGIGKLVAQPSLQGNWPTPWPPVTPPAVHLDAGDEVTPYRMWVQVMAVRPHPTDPPPCPVVVSTYP